MRIDFSAENVNGLDRMPGVVATGSYDLATTVVIFLPKLLPHGMYKILLMFLGGVIKEKKFQP